MEIKWTGKAISDLARLYDFLAAIDQSIAGRTVQSLVQAPDPLLEMPRIGEQLFEFTPREIRRLIVGSYEIRYEIQGDVVYMLRVWHTREDR